MTLLLTRHDVESLVTIREAIDAVEAAFRAYAAGLVVMPPRAVVRLDAHRATHLSMPAAMLGTPAVLAVKLVTTFPANPAKGLPAVLGLAVLHDADTGEVLAVMEAGRLTALRTGAASGVATKYLARPEAAAVALIGAGVQAAMQLDAVCAVRPIVSCRVFDADAQRAASFAERAVSRLGLTASVAESARDVVPGADIVIVATSSSKPVLKGRWLESGQHVIAIGTHTPDSREVDSEVVARSRVVPDLREACLAEAGDLLIPIREGVITPDDVGPSLGEVVAGTELGRQRTDQITFFKSVGLALEDAAVAELAYRQALARGVGARFDFQGY